MKTRFILSSLLLILFQSILHAKAYKYQTVAGDLMKARIYTLDNGLKVYLSVNKEKPRIQTYIAVRTGSRNDPSETTGLAHYLEHLMFKGTKQFGTTNAKKEASYLQDITQRYEKYRLLTDAAERKKAYHEIDSISQLAAQYNIPNEYDKLMAAIGSEGSNAFTSNDITCYVENIPSNEVDNWAKIQADRFQNMVIRGFHTELEAVYEEYNIGLSSDGRKQWNALNAKLFPTHPYGTQTTIGTQAHLKNPSIVNIQNYFKRYYVPNNVAICMAGDMNPDEVIATLDKYFGSWKKSQTLSYPTFAPQPDLKASVDTTVVGQEAENVLLAWKFDGAASMQNDTLTLVDKILSNGHAGLLDLDLNQSMKLLGSGSFVNALADYSSFCMEGLPKEGQSLQDVKQLLLAEVDKLKRGAFADDLLSSIINNAKRDYYKSLQSNRSRVSMLTDAFINNQKWEDVVNRLDRLAKISKQDIMAFANKHFKDNFVCVYKKQGEDTTQKKIDKPQITPIPSNRNERSAFLRDIQNAHTTPIQPRFLDFKRDLTFTKTKKKLPVVYKHNSDDGLFNLIFNWDFGTTANKEYAVACDYINYLGTSKKSAEDIKCEFYKLACSLNISADSRNIAISLTGLDENMPKAVKLLNELMTDAKPDAKAYEQYVALTLKARQDDKNDQRSNFNALRRYAMYGPYNQVRNIVSEQELKALQPRHLVDLFQSLKQYEQTVLYYGPTSTQQLSACLDKLYEPAKNRKPALKNKDYLEQTTPQNEVYIAPYNAKNIYMVMYHNENKPFDAKQAAVGTLFNEYFGGGMNTVVFQELREARGLAYSASAYYNNSPLKGHPEYAQTYIITQNDKMMDCIKVFNNILDTIPQSKTDFDIAKQGLMKQLASLRVTRGGVLQAYLKAKERGIDYDENERIYQALPSITMQDIVDFEQNNMARKPYRYVILGDEKNLNMQALQKIGKVKRLSTQEIFGY